MNTEEASDNIHQPLPATSTKLKTLPRSLIPQSVVKLRTYKSEQGPSKPESSADDEKRLGCTQRVCTSDKGIQNNESLRLDNGLLTKVNRMEKMVARLKRQLAKEKEKLDMVRWEQTQTSYKFPLPQFAPPRETFQNFPQLYNPYQPVPQIPYTQHFQPPPPPNYPYWTSPYFNTLIPELSGGPPHHHHHHPLAPYPQQQQLYGVLPPMFYPHNSNNPADDADHHHHHRRVTVTAAGPAKRNPYCNNDISGQKRYGGALWRQDGDDVADRHCLDLIGDINYEIARRHQSPPRNGKIRSKGGMDSVGERMEFSAGDIYNDNELCGW